MTEPLTVTFRLSLPFTLFTDEAAAGVVGQEMTDQGRVWGTVVGARAVEDGQALDVDVEVRPGSFEEGALRGPVEGLSGP